MASAPVSIPTRGHPSLVVLAGDRVRGAGGDCRWYPPTRLHREHWPGCRRSFEGQGGDAQAGRALRPHEMMPRPAHAETARGCMRARRLRMHLTARWAASRSPTTTSRRRRPSPRRSRKRSALTSSYDQYRDAHVVRRRARIYSHRPWAWSVPPSKLAYLAASRAFAVGVAWRRGCDGALSIYK